MIIASGLRAHSDDGLEGLGENKGAFFPPTADGADWDCGDPNEGHSCDINGANHGIHDWGTVEDGNRMAFACNSAGETRGNRGSQGDAAVCNNGVPPPVSVIASLIGSMHARSRLTSKALATELPDVQLRDSPGRRRPLRLAMDGGT